MTKAVSEIQRSISRLNEQEVCEVFGIVKKQMERLRDGHTQAEREAVTSALANEMDDDPEKELDASTPQFWDAFQSEAAELIGSGKRHG